MTAPLDFIDLKSQYAALKERIGQRMQAVLDHGQYIMGPEVKELEERLAAFTGAKHCITVASGTEALLIALMALDLQPGDEVITTAFTFAATAEMIVLRTPVLALGAARRAHRVASSSACTTRSWSASDRSALIGRLMTRCAARSLCGQHSAQQYAA